LSSDPLYFIENFFILFFYNKSTYHHIKIAVLIASVATYTEIHAGNSEAENNGYVVFKKMKYPWISWNIWWGGGHPHPFRQQALGI
jgi:hypothetical protein